MSDGGKGSAPRPFSVDRQTYENNWDLIFKKSEPKISNNDFQDILSTEDSILDAFDKTPR